jgi:hypothetical protein
MREVGRVRKVTLRALLAEYRIQNTHVHKITNVPCNGCCPHQNHYVPRHINNRYANSLNLEDPNCIMAGTWKLVCRILLLRREREQKLRRGKYRLSLGLIHAGHMTYEKKPINHHDSTGSVEGIRKPEVYN